VIELTRISDPVLLQVLCDALAERHVVFRVDNAGMNALMPLPGVMDARIVVDELNLGEARQVLSDLAANE
jgi:hypothetical protein